jgi:hypothetical protein
VGIAIAVALTLFIMSSTYNNLYQQQLQVREDRLREFIVLTSGKVYNTSEVPGETHWTVMDLAVANTGAVTAHVVSVYLNDELLNNSISTWISPASSAWTGNITLPSGKEIYPRDRIMVSTDRGTTSTAIAQGSWFGPSGAITPYQFQIIALNPTPPERKGITQFTLFQRRYFYFVIDKRLLSPTEYGLDMPAPSRFQDNPNATSYDPQGSVGVRAGVEYAIWMEEFQLDTPRVGGTYQIRAIRWAHYNMSVGGHLHPVILEIPIDWPTWTYTVAVMLGPPEYVPAPPPTWTIELRGLTTVNASQSYTYSGYVSFTGGKNLENLINVELTLTINAASNKYDVTNKYPAGGGGPITTIKFDLLLNGIDEKDYYWIVYWRPAAAGGKYTLTVTAQGTGQVTGDLYQSDPVSLTVTVT